MTTQKELLQYAKEFGFIDDINQLGFELGLGGLWFYRLRGEFIDYFSISIKSSGEWAMVPVVCITKELSTHCDISLFPKGFNNNLPFYSSTYLNEEYGVEIGHDPWCVKSKTEIRNTLKDISELVSLNAIPWFDNITDNKCLYDSFTENFKDSDNAKKIGQLLGVL